MQRPFATPERRKEPRAIVQLQGTVLSKGDLPSIACTVVEMSQLGASINSPDKAIPEEFVLSLTANASVVRECKVIWREGSTVGVQFIRKPKAPMPKAALDAKPCDGNR